MPPVTLDLEESKGDFSTRRALNDLSLAVAKCKKIVVVTGAGISCSSGIPDFRSSDGLYNLVKSQFPDAVLKGRDLFDASLFRDPTSTAVFYTFISQLKQMIDKAEPTPTHDFIKTLESKGKLLRSYTQNVDGLEERVGLIGNTGSSTVSSTSKAKTKTSTLKQCRNVQLHGDIHRVRCQSCSAEYPCAQEHLDLFSKGSSPDCPECLQRSNARIARSARALRVGSLRPAIVLYDEPHPLGDEIGVVQGLDVARKPDMLIIMGTSLKVHGLKKLVKDFAKAVHTHKSSSSSTPPKTTKSSSAKAFAGKVIFVNKTPPGSEWTDVIDYHVSGTTDEWAQCVVAEWKKMRPSDWEVQQTLVDGPELFKSVKDISGAAHVLPKGSGKGNSKASKGTKKKAVSRTHDEEENIPPPSNPDAMVLSTPDASRLLKSSYSTTAVESPMHMIVSPAPLSPSKRTRPQSQSHYSVEAQVALEASPSKRRVKNLPAIFESACPEPVGKVLFGNSREMLSIDDEEGGDYDGNLDVFMRSPPKAHPRLHPKSRTEVKPLAKSRSHTKIARTQGLKLVDSDVFAT
ncbi:hypothetical protein GYMLUDRAFT_92618 [Collybiopsis luxurians FD-317 M1]|nr:hypothetical protein GYMLUDRAFT_92618 [Collybiopsis luxurians FD-317 M1]